MDHQWENESSRRNWSWLAGRAVGWVAVECECVPGRSTLEAFSLSFVPLFLCDGVKENIRTRCAGKEGEKQQQK